MRSYKQMPIIYLNSSFRKKMKISTFIVMAPEFTSQKIEGKLVRMDFEEVEEGVMTVLKKKGM